MKMRSLVADDLRKLEVLAEEHHITKDQIITTFQTKDGVFVLTYFEED